MKNLQSEFTCQDCAYFIRHYVRYPSGKYVIIDFGHCFRPRIKSRMAETPACERFKTRAEEKTADA